MDYLEGFLIGPVWSDTEYQTRSHKMLHLLLSAAVAALYLFLLFFPAHRSKVLVIPLEIGAVILVILLILTPFISCFYYRVPFFFRPVLLLFYVATYLIAISTLLHVVLPLWQPDLDLLSSYFINTINERINVMTAAFDPLGPLFGMIAGIVVGGLWSVGEVLLVFLILILTPLLVILLVKGLRYLMDRLIVSFVFVASKRR